MLLFLVLVVVATAIDTQEGMLLLFLIAIIFTFTVFEKRASANEADGASLVRDWTSYYSLLIISYY